MSGNELTGKQGTKIWHWKRMTLLGVLIVAILVVITVLKPWDIVPGYQNDIDKAYAATSDIQSFRYSLTNTSEDSDGFSIHQSIEAEFASPDRYHLNTIENGQATEFIIIGDQQYFSGESLPWAMLDASMQGLTRSVSKEAALIYLDQLTDIQSLSDETIDGVSCLHYLGKWDVEKQIAETKRSWIEAQAEVGIVPDEEEIDEQLEYLRLTELEIELWIGRDDYLLRQIQVNGKSPDDDEGVKFRTMSFTMKYYDINQSITIEAPLDADGQLLPGWQMVDSS